MKYVLSRGGFTAFLGWMLTAALLATPGCGAPEKPKVEAASEVKAGQYAFWPIFPDDPRIQFLRSFGTSDDVNPATPSAIEKLVFGKEGEKTASINKPYGVAMKNGKIYVCDIRGRSIVVLDLKKKQTRLVGTTGLHQVAHPVAITVADDGMIYVADNERCAVMVFDANERYSASMGYDKMKPVAVAVFGDTLYVSDLGNQTIAMFDRKSGKKTSSFGTVGDADGQFRVPLGLAVDKVGNVYVTDMMRCTVQKFSPKGEFISAYGQMGDRPGQFARPKHIAVDADGIQYIVDAAFSNVQLFDDKKQLLMAFGALGDFPGAMDVPAGICISEDGLDLFQSLVHPGFQAKRLLIVSNQFGTRKINVYALGELKQGWTAQQLAAVAAEVSPGTGVSEDQAQLQKAVGNLPDAQPSDEANPPDGEVEASPAPEAPKTPK